MKTMLRVIFTLILFPPSILHAGNTSPIVDFTADQTNGCGPLTVTFTDQSFESSGDPFVSWFWDFGDGTTSVDFSPVHNYAVAGIYNVTLQVTSQSNWKGSATKTGYITVLASPVVNLGPDAIICAGTAATLDAETPGATYLWNDGSTTPQLETFFDGEYSVEVFKDGCVGRDTIYVQQGNVLYADFNYDQTGTCTPIGTQFTEYSEACNGSVVQWTWDFGDGNTSTDRNPLHNYLLPGDYTVSLTVRKNTGSVYTATKVVTITGTNTPAVDLGPDATICDGTQLTLSAGNPGANYSWSTGETTSDITIFDGGVYKVTVTKDGCTAEDSVNVLWKPALWSDFTFAKISGCVPVDMQFTDKSSACQSVITGWLWDFGDGNTSTSQNPQHTYTSIGQFAVKLTVTDENGSSITRSKKVTVDPPSFSVNLGKDTTICFGEALTLDAGNPGASYTWSTGETGQQIVIYDDGDYSVTVNINGCEVKDTINLKTSASAVAGWSAIVGGACLPVTVSFTDSSKAFCGQVINKWKWDFGDGTISTMQNPKHDYLSADSFVVRLTVTSSGGSSVSKIKLVNVRNTLLQTYQPVNYNTCTGGMVELDAHVSGAKYSWTPSFGLNASDIRNPVATPIRSMWYTVDVTKCMVTVRDSFYVSLDSIVSPAIKQEGNMLKASENFKYQWYHNGKLISGATARSLRVDHAGYYSVKGTNRSGCISESAPYFYLPVSSDDDEKGTEKLRIKCSPNPNHGIITILISQVPKKPAKVTLIDGIGRRLYSTEIQDHETTLNRLKLAKGLYFVEVVIEKERRMIPVVVQ